MKTIEELQLLSTQTRRDILRMVNAVKSGHPGGSLGCADFLTSLYFNYMKIDPTTFEMDGNQEDLFFLSNGHISPVLYSVLARRGYFPVSELSSFRKLGTRLQGHPCVNEKLEGIRIASGSLGQGLSVALGAALSKKMNGDPNLVYCLTGYLPYIIYDIWRQGRKASYANSIQHDINGGLREPGADHSLRGEYPVTPRPAAGHCR